MSATLEPRLDIGKFREDIGNIRKFYGETPKDQWPISAHFGEAAIMADALIYDVRKAAVRLEKVPLSNPKKVQLLAELQDGINEDSGECRPSQN